MLFDLVGFETPYASLDRAGRAVVILVRPCSPCHTFRHCRLPRTLGPMYKRFQGLYLTVSADAVRRVRSRWVTNILLYQIVSTVMTELWS